ncbi:MAG TPA: TIM barrel protein [Thermomicrobiales bacterium]|nr:TIM barrel protein [Thermomicrobiales bacterium]
MIRFGPAAAPRWFDCDLAQFPAYLDHIASHGATAIEFVALPEIGTPENRRVHISEPDWPGHVAAAHAAGLTINVHWPLLPGYRLETFQSASNVFGEHARHILAMVDRVSAGQAVPPKLVLHGNSESWVATQSALSEIQRLSSDSLQIVLEQRAPQSAGDQRWDRSLESLTRTLAEGPDRRTGVCWDIANDFLREADVQFPEDSALSLIRHIHLHDSRPDRAVHAPLGVGRVPWQNMLILLRERDWNGSLTLEIRYRYACEVGEPWTVLADSLDKVRHVLLEEKS